MRTCQRARSILEQLSSIIPRSQWFVGPGKLINYFISGTDTSKSVESRGRAPWILRRTVESFNGCKEGQRECSS